MISYKIIGHILFKLVLCPDMEDSMFNAINVYFTAYTGFYTMLTDPAEYLTALLQ